MALAERASVGSRHHPQPIHLSQTYPCPCCHQGQLRGITLTEALGCDRCQYIFALSPDHLQIENLTASYPYRKLWFWSGSQWVLARAENETGFPVLRILIPALLLFIFVFILITDRVELILPWHSILILLLVMGIGLGIGILLSSRR